MDNHDECALSALEETSLYYKKLATFDLSQWSSEEAIDLLCLMVKFEDSGCLSHNFYAGNALYELLRLWRPTSSTATDFICALCELKQVDMADLIICLVGCPCRLDEFDCFLGEVLFHLNHRKPEIWNNEWIAELLSKLESDLDCCDVDTVDVLCSFGKQLKDPGKLGKLAHSYLLATGLQNSFECRCKTPECLCPVEVDEGVAFILFDGLVRRLELNMSEKRTFFCQAVDKLFGLDVLSELGNCPYKIFKCNFMYENNISYVRCFNSICKIKIS